MVKWTFVVLTLVKATYIVMTFMHLGDERRNIRAIILLPYALFILYLLFIAIFESNLVHQAWLRYL
jgi:cytochrome c oxidase subunit 4